MTTPAPVRATCHSPVDASADWREQLHVEMDDGSVWVYALDGTVTHHQPPHGLRWALSHTDQMCATDGTRATIRGDGTLDTPTPTVPSPRSGVPDGGATLVVADGALTWAIDTRNDLWLSDPYADHGNWLHTAGDIATVATSPDGNFAAVDLDGHLHTYMGPGLEPLLDTATVTQIAFLGRGLAALDADRQVWLTGEHPPVSSRSLAADRPAISGVDQIAADDYALSRIVTLDATTGTLARRPVGDPTVTVTTWRLDIDQPRLLATTTRAAILADTDNQLWVVGDLNTTSNDAPVALGQIGSPELALCWELAITAPNGTPLAALAHAAHRLN